MRLCNTWGSSRVTLSPLTSLAPPNLLDPNIARCEAEPGDNGKSVTKALQPTSALLQVSASNLLRKNVVGATNGRLAAPVLR